MKFWRRSVLLVALFQLATVRGADAQLFDWIHKLTGIQLTRVGIQQVFEVGGQQELRAISVAPTRRATESAS